MINALDIIETIVEEQGFTEITSGPGDQLVEYDTPANVDYMGIKRDPKTYQKYNRTIVITTKKHVSIVIIIDEEICKISECDISSWNGPYKVDLREDDLESIIMNAIERNS